MSGLHPIYEAAAKGDVAALEAELKTGVNIDLIEVVWTPLQTAVFHKRVGAVKFLLERKANILAGKNMTAVHTAAPNSSAEILQLLLDQRRSRASTSWIQTVGLR